MNKNKLWIVSEFFYPIENATGFIITKIVDKLAVDSKINVITLGDSIKERSNNISTIRIKEVVSLDKNKLIQRIVKQLLISVRFLLSILKNVKKNDTVVTVTNPALNLIFLSLIKRIKKINLIIIVHDVFPENLIVTGISNESKLVYKIAKGLFNYAYNKGDILITLGRDMQKKIQNKVKNKENVVCIQNFSDTFNIFPSIKEENTILAKNKLVNKFIVLFTGNIGRMQNIDRLLETIKILKKDIDIHFLFIGEGAYVEKMKDFIKENSLFNITMLPNMSREKENDFLNAGDIGLVSLVPNVMGTGVPSKTYSYMAAGKPILAFLDEDSEIAIMTKEENIGWVVNPNNPIELAEKIIEIKNNKEEVITKGKKSREVAVEKYSLDIITEKYSKAIKSKIS